MGFDFILFGVLSVTHTSAFHWNEKKDTFEQMPDDIDKNGEAVK
jgi:hypothetical protein